MNTKIMRTIAGIILAAALALSLPAFAAGVKAEEVHTHDGITFTAWNNGTKLPSTPGDYYLMQDIDQSIQPTGWTVPAGTTRLCLNGHKILLPNGFLCSDSGIMINSGATLELYDCGDGAVTASGDQSKNGVHVNGGTFILNSGTIKDISTTLGGSMGGGVLIDSGEFVMNGGTISGNESLEAGGVRVNGGEFIMKGGSISENRSGQGGVCVKDGTFTMEGGTISQNTYTCGVYVDGGTFTMKGGTISNNEHNHGGCGGVNVFKGIFNHYGGTITDNKSEDVKCENMRTVTYNSNGGSGSMPIQYITHNDHPLMENAFIRDGYDFTGWNTRTDGLGESYSDKQAVSLTYNLTLYAQWKVMPKTSIAKADISGVKDKVYSGKQQTQKPVVKLGGKKLIEGTDYKVSYQNNVKAGKNAAVIITGIGSYKDSRSVTFQIRKAANPLKVSGKTVSLKAKDLKNDKKVAASKAYTYKKKGIGKRSYKIDRVTPAKYRKFFSVDKKGNIKIKKGLKKGSYKVFVKVTAKGDKNYNSGSGKAKVTIKVKK